MLITPLFNQKLLQPKLSTNVFPPDLLDRHRIMASLVEMSKTGTLDRYNEVQLESFFWEKILGQVLGYSGLVSSSVQVPTYHPKLATNAGTQADAALGFFPTEGEHRVVAAVEIKAAHIGLDARIAGKQSAIEQGWGYANNLSGCKWIIVSNFREFRLYHRDHTQQKYERILLGDLEEIHVFKRFYWLFSAGNLLPKDGQASELEKLLSQSIALEKDITNKLYAQYKAYRQDVLDHFQKSTKEPFEICLEKAQKLMDRILFLCFAEDRGLLEKHTLRAQMSAKVMGSNFWDRLLLLFNAVNDGYVSEDGEVKISRYNGGLFAPDPFLDKPAVLPNKLAQQIKDFTEWDYASEVSVNVLGHIFEQSITDLEAMHAEAKGVTADKKSSKVKKEGVVYTPAYITRFIVQKAIGGCLAEAISALPKPSEDDAASQLEYWQRYLDLLKSLKVLDPACGSGAFLIAAYDVLHEEYNRCLSVLLDFTNGRTEFFDHTNYILRNNLYGVDLNFESVEITKLSLWLKTAQQGKVLTDLDHTIRCGNSIIDDASVDSKAFDWPSAFPEVFERECPGFDVVIGNPPYVRMEYLKVIKPYLEKKYKVASDRADLYQYFIEQGMRLLREGGYLGFITSGTFTRTRAGLELREFIQNGATLQGFIDFGDLQPFEDKTTYPAIMIAQKKPKPADWEFPALNLRSIPTSETADLSTTFDAEQFPVRQDGLKSSGWSIAKKPVLFLREKLSMAGRPLKDVCGAPLYGIKTGLNEAFVVDQASRDRLVYDDPKSAELLKPFLIGENLKPWHIEPEGLWIIYIPKNRIMIDDYPAILDHLMPFKEKLEARATKQEWFELQQAQEAFVPFLERPKIVYSDISIRPCFSIDKNHYYCNNMIYYITNGDTGNDLEFIIGLLSSKCAWFQMKSMSTSLRGGFIRMFSEYIERIRIPSSVAPEGSSIPSLSVSIQSLGEQLYQLEFGVRHRIHTDLGMHNSSIPLGEKLSAWHELTFPTFREAIQKRFKKDILLRERDEWERYLLESKTEHRCLTDEIHRLEAELNDLVYDLYGLTAEERRIVEAETHLD